MADEQNLLLLSVDRIVVGSTSLERDRFGIRNAHVVVWFTVCKFVFDFIRHISRGGSSFIEPHFAFKI